MQISSMKMEDFMGRFGLTLFDRAKENLDPEYIPGAEQHEWLEYRLKNQPLFRTPFPGQDHAILAAHQHLEYQDEKMVNLSSEMGTGKTLIAMIIAALCARPQRAIVVCPPHLVQKWAREIRTTLPDVDVFTINHSGANQVLAKHAAENPGHPKRLTFYVIGKVRLRISFHRKPAVNYRRFHGIHRGRSKFATCPDCGRPLLRKLSKAEISRAIDAGLSGSQFVLPAFTPDASSSSAPVSGDEETQATDDWFEYVTHSDLEKAQNQQCNFVHDLAQGGAVTGCGAALWQAVRAHPRTPEEAVRKSLLSLPTVGAQKATQIALLPNRTQVLQALENGEILPDLARILGPKGTQKVDAEISQSGFTFADGDYAPVDFIQRYLPRHWFDYALLDELHELKGGDSLVGVAFGRLAGCVRKVVGLTGTLVDGYAQSLHPLLFRANPKRMLELGFDHNESARFQREMGVIKEYVTEEAEPDKATGRPWRVVSRQTRNLPGLHPSVITNILLPNTVFLTLAEVEAGLRDLGARHGKKINLLPSCREVFVRIPMDNARPDLLTDDSGDSTVQRPYVIEMTEFLLEKLKEHLKNHEHFVLAPIISALLHFPDTGFQDFTVYSDRLEFPVIAELQNFGTHWHPKERFLQELAVREKDEGRKLLLYTVYTDKLDLTPRYRAAMEAVGMKVAVLKSNVPTEKREAWVQEQLRKGIDVLICNPELVKTGLDLFDFTTIVFAQSGYRTDTVQQASRRSWRIGQTQPVRVYYLGYDESAQMQALSLIGKKMVVSNQAQGSIAKIGLSEAIEDDSETGMMALANAILDQVRDKSRDAITGSITCLAEDSCDGEFSASPMSVLQELLRPANTPTSPKAEEAGDFLDDMFAEISSAESSPTAPAPAVPVPMPKAPKAPKPAKSKARSSVPLTDDDDLFSFVDLLSDLGAPQITDVTTKPKAKKTKRTRAKSPASENQLDLF